MLCSTLDLDDEMFAQGILEEFRVDLDFDENLEEARNAVKKLRNGSQRVELTFLGVRKIIK